MEYPQQSRGKNDFSPYFIRHFLLLLRNIPENWIDGRSGKNLQVGDYFNQKLKFMVEIGLNAKFRYQRVIYPLYFYPLTTLSCFIIPIEDYYRSLAI